MKIIVKPSFDRDIDKINHKEELKVALNEKLKQIERAKTIEHFTGLKLLEGYTHHYRIVVKAGKFTYRIGAIIRGDKIWLVRFLRRRIVYKRFP